MRLFYTSLLVSLIGFLVTCLFMIRSAGEQLSVEHLLIVAWQLLPYFPWVVGALLVRYQPVPGAFALTACIATAATGIGILLKANSGPPDAQEGLIYLFLPIYQLAPAGLLLVVTAVVAAIYRRPTIGQPSMHAR